MASHYLNIEKGGQSACQEIWEFWILWECEFSDKKRHTYCDQNDIGNEFHSILKCPQYLHWRIRYIKRFYYTKEMSSNWLKSLTI